MIIMKKYLAITLVLIQIFACLMPVAAFAGNNTAAFEEISFSAEGYHFCVREEDEVLCLYLVDGENPLLLAADISFRFPQPLWLKGRIYFSTAEGKIASVLPNGSDRKTECDDRGFLMTDGESLFFGDDRHIAKLLPDGSIEVLLKVRPLVNESYFTVMNMIDRMLISGDSIYYTLRLAENVELREIKTDGTGDRRIADAFPVTFESAALYEAEDGSLIVAAFYENGALRQMPIPVEK